MKLSSMARLFDCLVLATSLCGEGLLEEAPNAAPQVAPAQEVESSRRACVFNRIDAADPSSERAERRVTGRVD